MDYTYEKLCEKMGYDPLKDGPLEVHNYEDDTPSPYTKLSYEELKAFEKLYKVRVANA